MNKKRNRRTLLLALTALLLSLGAAAGSAMAYFTTYVTAQGGHELSLGFTTTIPNEKVSDWSKTITLTNTGERDCYVRLKVFAGSSYTLTYEFDQNGGWSLGSDGYYYWHEILRPGETAGHTGGGETPDDAFVVRIGKPQDANQSFNIIVVQECTPVPFDENGNPLAWDQVDWSRTADVVKTETQETVNGGEDKQ